VTQQQIDEAQGKHQVAEATVSRLKAELARTDALLDYATIKAPFDGIVTDRFVDAGAMIQTGAASSGAPIVTLMNMDTVRVFINVPEPDVRFVTHQTSVILTVDSLPGGDFAGKVTRYSTALNPKTRTMKTEIDFPNADHALRPGMYGVATLELEKHEGALTLPATALLVEKDAALVYIVVDGKAKRSLVRTGLNDGIVVEILEGLTGVESVIVAGKGSVTEGTPVRPGSQE
jgi:RND family efflux transporter MFP subunit